MNQEAKDDLACGGWIAAFIAVLVGMVIILCGGGCINPRGPITVNVFSSRMVIASGTNTVRQAVDGGAATSPQLGLGDSAIEKGIRAATGGAPQSAAGALDALKEIKP